MPGLDYCVKPCALVLYIFEMKNTNQSAKEAWRSAGIIKKSSRKIKSIIHMLVQNWHTDTESQFGTKFTTPNDSLEQCNLNFESAETI